MPRITEQNMLKINYHVYDTETKLTGIIENIITVNNAGETKAVIYVLFDNGSRATGGETRFLEIKPGQVRIKQMDPFIVSTPYSIDIPLGYLENNLATIAGNLENLDLNPDFQRGHVWTSEQQERFIEYRLRGGLYGRDIWFNCADWNRGNRAPVQIVDGLQRLTAIRQFLDNNVRAFGQLFSEFHPDDQIDIKYGLSTSIKFHVNNLPERKDVLKWYIDLNAGGTPHSSMEIERVKKLLQDVS